MLCCLDVCLLKVSGLESSLMSGLLPPLRLPELILSVRGRYSADALLV